MIVAGLGYLDFLSSEKFEKVANMLQLQSIKNFSKIQETMKIFQIAEKGLKEDKQNDNLGIGFDAVIIDENVLRESSQEKEFYFDT